MTPEMINIVVWFTISLVSTLIIALTALMFTAKEKFVQLTHRKQIRKWRNKNDVE